MKGKITAKRIAFYAGIVVVWQIVFSLNIWTENIFPSPIQVVEDLAYGAADGSLFF